MPVVFVGIGSNLGNRAENCATAIREMSNFAKISAVSSIYETEPVGRENQPDFINCITKIETGLSPYELLLSLLSVENKLGRKHTQKWGPRIIDLDILFYDDLIVDSGELTIPHPRAHLRRFVLEPLSEIAPDFVLPGQTRSVKQLLADLGPGEDVRKLTP